MMPLCIFLALLYKICQVLAGNMPSVLQESGIKTAKVGAEVTLECRCQDDAVTFLSWYQQSLGGKPEIISTRMKHNPEAEIYPKYKKRFRVIVESQNSVEYLKIANLSLSDSGTYYCGVLVFNAIEFGQGVFLHVKTSVTNIGSAIAQPTLKPLRLGQSLNLNCTVEAEPCTGEPNFYWFRHGASQSAVMYPSEGHTCTSISKETPHRQNCTLNLAIKSVSSSDAGIYYCALASCGEIIFGNGTKVEIVVPPVLVYCLSVALAVSIIVLLVLAFIMYKLRKRLCSVCKGTVSHQTCSAVSDAVSQDADHLHYAALNLKRSTKQHRQEENVDNVCVYSRVKSRKV
uniref:Ig-like domain-containing protein n=1 Tax=Amphilophus citrinellus TaxID=61819 RepID=A0A3Q0S891_AMPCI